MLKRAGSITWFLCALSALSFLSVSSSDAEVGLHSGGPSYTIKPSDVRVPPGIALGQYRRIIEPFPNWTLICDDNLKTKQRVCNITQNIINETGINIFSWSLAANQNGQPLFILRVSSKSGVGTAINLGLNDGGPIVPVKINSCDRNVCVAYQTVGPRLRAAIKKGASVGVIFNDGSGADDIAFKTSFLGLERALSGIH